MRTRFGLWRMTTPVAAAIACWAASCGSSDDSGSEFAGGNGGASASSGSGGSGAVTVGDGSHSGGSSGSLSEDAACASDELEAKLLPLAMFIMLDKSGSMGDGGKWTGAEAGLTQLV